MSDPASFRVQESALTEMVFTDSIPYSKTCDKVKQLSIADIDVYKRQIGNRMIYPASPTILDNSPKTITSRIMRQGSRGRRTPLDVYKRQVFMSVISVRSWIANFFT